MIEVDSRHKRVSLYSNILVAHMNNGSQGYGGRTKGRQAIIIIMAAQAQGQCRLQTASGSRSHVYREFDDIAKGKLRGKSRSEPGKRGGVENTARHYYSFLLPPYLHSYHHSPSLRKASHAVQLYLPQPFRPPKREFPLPQHRSGGIFAAAKPLPRCQPLAHDLNVHTFSHTSSPTPLHLSEVTTHTKYLNTPLTLPEQQFWLPPPFRPAFGHLKGTSRTTAPTASDRVISQIASIRKNKDTLNSKPPPSLGFASGS